MKHENKHGNCPPPRARQKSLWPRWPKRWRPIVTTCRSCSEGKRVSTVLIKGSDVGGVFRDRSEALREGYQRLGVVPFLVRQIVASEPVVYLPNVVP